MKGGDTGDRLAGLSPEKRALLVRRLRERSAGRDPEAWPKVEPDPAARHDPFPLTPLQQAYWVGRDASFEMGQVATHSYMELDATGLDPTRAIDAWNRLVRRHDMLRARFLPDGRQQVLASVPDYEVAVHDLSGLDPDERARSLLDIRERMSHAVFDPARWPLFHLEAATGPGGALRLFLGVDALIVDAWSVRLLFEEWAALYEDPDADLPEAEIQFRDYVTALGALEETDRFARARDYWVEAVASLPPPPELPMARSPAELETVRFVRRTRRLSASRWRQLQVRAAAAGMTPAAALLAAYADVLSIWGASPRFTVSVPQFNRHPLHEDVAAIVGEFASFDLLAIDNEGDAPFAERARRHQERLWADLDHATFGGVRVLRELGRRRGDGSTPIMPVVFTMAPQGSGAGGVGPSLPEDLWSVDYVNNQSSQVWLDNHLSEAEGELVCDWDTVDGLFPPAMPEDMLGAYMTHLERLADDDGWWERSWVEAAAGLLPASHVRVHDEANDTAAPIPSERVQDAFFRHAAADPEAPAVLTPSGSLDRGQLVTEIAGLAARLEAAGVGPGDRVGVVMEKGWEQVAAVYATLERGAAYVPLDPADPPARRERLLARAAPAAVLTQPWLLETGGWPAGMEPMGVERSMSGDGARLPDDRRRAEHPEGLAVILYTSGSTGEPKGVRVGHAGLVNALVATAREYEIGSADRVLGLTPLHHDMSAFDLFGVLGAGGTLVLPDPGGRRDPAHWAELVARHGVTLWNSVPAMMTMLLAWAEGQPGALGETLRLAFLGGDWIPVTLPDRLRALVPGIRVVSVGGPTETTLWNIWHEVRDVDTAAASIPYGRPIANTKYHVIGEAGVERPLWVPGVLWVTGAGVTDGYLDDEDASAARRGTHPRTGDPMWSTGDLGRRLPDGEIEFLGRRDFQVQIHGVRVELGEIEAQLARLPGVAAAVVGAVPDPRGAPRLVAWVVPAEGEAIVQEELAEALGRRLPPHMVPRTILLLDALPLTPNGKVDRRALPEPPVAPPDAERAGAGEAAAGARAVSPAASTASGADDGLETRLADLVADVIGTRPEPEVNLLEYGANSIDMVRIGNRLEETFGRRPRIDEIFRLQTVRALAGFYAELERTETDPAGRGAEPADPIAAKLARYRVALSPEERKAFKDRRLGVRSDLSDARRVPHPALPEDELDARFWERRSHRRFRLRAIPAETFAGFLAGLAERRIHDRPKRLYPSPGGLYPTQAYVHVKPGRVEGIEGGVYYYDPIEQTLVEVAAGAEIDRSLHIPFVNAPVFDEAAFSIFFVVQLDAIGPMYGERSLHFAALETGGMAATLEAWGARWGIGLCQIGDVRFDEVRDLFQLNDGHVFLHSLVGGLSTGDDPRSTEIVGPGEEEQRARLAEEIEGMSPEEIAALLATRAGEGDG